MRIREVMTHTVITLDPLQSVASAMGVFIRYTIKGAPVVEHGKVLGVVSEKDIFRALYPSVAEYYDNPELWLEEQELEASARGVSEKPVQAFMTRDIITVPPDTPIMQVGAMMLAHRVHRILVMESGKLVGIATRTDIFRTVFKRILP